MSTQERSVSPTIPDHKFEIKNDLELLDLMLSDARSQPALYQPGPYWAANAENSANEIRRCGLSDFRGSENLIGLSYADNLLVDLRNAYNRGLRRLAQRLTNTYPLNRVYESQVRLTESYANESTRYAQEIFTLKERTRKLLKKYIMPYSLLGKCLRKVEIESREYSIGYLEILEQHDNIASRIKFENAHSIFEIGGGFGINVHLLLENYKNIRKVFYLDIPPTLYVGTQYLKAFYGSAVRDYRALRNADTMDFSANDELEILCVAPWQIERFKGTVDVFMNSRSFVEMPPKVVQNYVDNFKRFPGSKDAAIALTAYDGFNLNTTFHPGELPKFFKDREFEHFEVETPLNSSRKNLYFVSPGKLLRS